MNAISKSRSVPVRTHSLETQQPWFDLLISGQKPFVICYNDRAFQCGDVLELVESAKGSSTGRKCWREVTMVTSFKQQEGWVVMGIRPLDDDAKGGRGCRVNPDPLWTIQDLAVRWGLAEAMQAKPEATRRRIRDMAARLKIKAVVLSVKEKSYRPSDVLKAEEAAARR